MKVKSYTITYLNDTNALELSDLEGMKFDVVISEKSCMVFCLDNYETEEVATIDPVAAVGEYIDHLYGVCVDVYAPAEDGDGWEPSGKVILPSEGIKLEEVQRWC